MKGIVKARRIINDLVIQTICGFMYAYKAIFRKLIIVSLHVLHIFLTSNSQFYSSKQAFSHVIAPISIGAF